MQLLFSKKKNFFLRQGILLREQRSFEGRNHDHFDYDSGKNSTLLYKNLLFAPRHLTCCNFSAKLKMKAVCHSFQTNLPVHLHAGGLYEII